MDKATSKNYIKIYICILVQFKYDGNFYYYVQVTYIERFLF